MKEDIKIANKHMTRCSTPFVIRELKIKTTTRYHFIPTGMTVLKKANNIY